MIVILPGCLMLLAVWVERASVAWRQPTAAVLLLLYLGIGIGDFTLRPRWMFHQLVDIIAVAPQKAPTNAIPTKPTLIAMNSQAWGHVMRLAYYIPPSIPVMLLAKKSSDLAPALEKALQSPSISEKSCDKSSTSISECFAATLTGYDRVLWLDSGEPVWSPNTTEAEKQQIQKVLEARFQLKNTQSVSGTMNLDEFRIHLYD